MRNISVLVRLVPVGLLALAIQRVFFANHLVAGVKVQFVLALVAAAGAAGGPDRGAIAGFVLGVLSDLAGSTPIGLVALSFGIGGWVAGYVQTITPDPQWWLGSLFAAIGAAFGEAAVPAIELITGEEAWIGRRLALTVPIVAAAAFVLYPALAPVGRWMMGAKRPKWKAIPE